MQATNIIYGTERRKPILPLILPWLGIALILLSGLALLLVSQRSSGFATWYAANIFPVFPRIFGWFWGLFPFSVFEILLILFSLCILFGFIILIASMRNYKSRAKLKTRAKAIVLGILYFISAMFLIFVLTAGINYNRESFADHIGITVQASSLDELIQLYLLLAERADMLSEQIATDGDGFFMIRREGLCLYDNARQSMYDLNGLYGGLSYFLPRAKAPMLSRFIMSNANIAGFFSPWTMEAHYNGDMPDNTVPFVINHELAHVSGHMREEEANFIANLASRNSEFADFQYSAVYVALSYTLQALRRSVSPAQYNELFNLLPQQIIRDFTASRAYWRQFEGPVADMQVRVNDAYLRLNQQEDGVQSYGRMLDLLLAYYRTRGYLGGFNGA